MLEDILAHCSDHTQERCGLIVRKNGEPVFVPAKNIADSPTETFVLDPDAWIAASEIGEVEAVVHSHPDGPAVLSGADRIAQVQTGLEWWLVADGLIRTFPYTPPLLGRKFRHGQDDCYSIIRSAYALAGHPLPDFERPDDWWQGDAEIYLDNVKSAGFYQVSLEEIQPGDVLFIRLASKRVNHGAIYLGDQKMLHHCPGQLSQRALFGRHWINNCHSVWRHHQWQPSDFMGIWNDLAAHSG